MQSPSSPCPPAAPPPETRTGAVLSIAGSDPSGGAGLQGDLRAIAANGGYGACVVTAITVQNTLGVTGVTPLAADVIRAQLDAVVGDLNVRAIKSGMLGSDGAIGVVAGALRDVPHIPYVCDPVLVSSSGRALLPPQSVRQLQTELFPLTTVLTPNAGEARALTGVHVCDRPSALRAGRLLLEMGPRAVLVKGGHLREREAVDILLTRHTVREFGAAWGGNGHTHGTGCMLASAIATHLAHGRSIEEAVGVAKRFISAAIEHGLAVGRGIGPPNAFFFMGDAGAAAQWVRNGLAPRGER